MTGAAEAGGVRPDLGAVAASLAASGLVLRGGFDVGGVGDVPPGPSGLPTRSVLLVGQAGASFWPRFARWRQRRGAGCADPLDAWSAEVIGAVARDCGARAVFPSERPFLPFQQWAMRAEGLRSSPLGILMHPDYGLWHAFRGALLFEQELGIEAARASIHLCDLCPGKPCLSACPADAHSEHGFAREACVAHLESGCGATCRAAGCLARNACPHGAEFRYPAEVQAFFQASFTRG